MANDPIPVLFYYTDKSIQQHSSEFNDIINVLRDKNRFDLRECSTFDEAAALLGPKARFNVVLVHLHSSEKDLWRKIFYKAKAGNKFSEVIVIVADRDEQDAIDAGQVLNGGCFAFFQYTFSTEVLLGYIDAAYRKFEIRQIKAKLSREINEGVNTPDGVSITVKDVVEKIATQLYELTNYDIITIALLKRGRPEQGFLRKLVYTNIDRSVEVDWKLLRPTAEDPLISRILLGQLERRIFSDPRNDDDIKMIFDADHLIPAVNSWIALPLRYDGVPIGFITLDGFEKNHFNYEKINELFLEQIANQSAAAIRYAEKVEVHQRLGKALNALNSSAGIVEILDQLAEQACELVGGLFSYIVVPDQAQIRLEFKGAWSRYEKKDYIKRLETKVVFPTPGEKVFKPGFLLPPYNSELEEPRGITTLAFTSRRQRLLENIRDENYVETDEEAKKFYYPFTYWHKDEMGREHTILPASDIALPILLEDSFVQPSRGSGSPDALGVINIEHEKPYAFTEEQISALKQLAGFAAIAIQKWKKQELVSDLYDLGDHPYQDNLPFDKSIANMEKYLHEVARNVKSVSKAMQVAVHVVKDNKSFTIGRSDLRQEVQEGSRWGNDETEGHTFWSVRNRKPVIINDTAEYSKAPADYTDIFGESYMRPNNSPIEINPLTDTEKIKALVCIPMIITGQKVVGVIWMQHETNPRYTQEEIRILEKFAGNIANIINVVEKITFLKIENEIGSVEDKETVLENIVESAKVYFGLRGAVIYEADHQKKELRIARSSFKGFSAKKNIRFNRETPDGLTGHLMLGVNKGDYLYKKGIVYIPDYRRYAHAMEYTEAEKEKLGSLIGIRFPLDVPPEKAIGVLVVVDAPVVPGEGGRIYDGSIDDLKRFANVAGKCLESITVKKTTNNMGKFKSQLPEDLLAEAEAKYDKLFDRSIILLSLIIFFALLFLFKNNPFFMDLPPIVKIFAVASPIPITWRFSPRLRENFVVTLLASIVVSALADLITKWLS